MAFLLGLEHDLIGTSSNKLFAILFVMPNRTQSDSSLYSDPLVMPTVFPRKVRALASETIASVHR